MRRFSPWAAVLIVVLIGGAVLFLQQGNFFQTQTMRPTPTPAPTDTLSPIPTPTPASDVPANWETYTSSQHEFEMLYPTEVEISETAQGGVEFTRIGPTQTEGTEIFDGFTVSIRQEGYTENNLEQAVQNRHREVQEEPVTEVVSDIRPVTIAEVQGYTFTIRGLGEFEYYFIPAGDQEYLFISKMVADPENLGYEQTVMQMLSTLEIVP